MTQDEIKNALVKAAKKAWPNIARASNLPFPDYWKSALEWLAFHAPHVGDGLMGQLIADVVRDAVLAQAAGKEPRVRVVSDKVREIWSGAGETGAASVRQQGTWDRAAERAQAVRDRFDMRMVQGRFI